MPVTLVTKIAGTIVWNNTLVVCVKEIPNKIIFYLVLIGAI